MATSYRLLLVPVRISAKIFLAGTFDVAAMASPERIVLPLMIVSAGFTVAYGEAADTIVASVPPILGLALLAVPS